MTHPVRREHVAGGTWSESVWTPCLRHRLSLTRIWNSTLPRLAIVMLNPSTADETRNDATVARCESRARSWGHGAFRVVNLFSLCATRPADLIAAPDPQAPGADQALLDAIAWADAVLCAWGNQGRHLGRDGVVVAMIRNSGKPMLHLGLTLQGAPRHPLYLAAATLPVTWDAEG